MTDLLISDLHLSPERPAITRAFFDFLDTRAKNARALYILGDLVEAWIGDDDPDQLARNIVARLRDLSDSGTALYIQHGNRDFLMGKRFARETGAILLGDYHVIDNPEYSDLGRILLCHGDTLCSDDVDYQKFRRKVRNPINRWLLSHLPLKKRQEIARKWRTQSSAANSNKADNIMDVNSDTVAREMSARNAQTLIHGHTHRPAVHNIASGQRIVLGDWDNKGWYITLTHEGATLNAFEISA